jgi:pimeloyl-ACP methyl ester carboxylesterase
VSARALTVDAAGTRFDVLAAGPEDGPLTLLLHGFPQDASAYDRVLPLLADAGLRAVAVTQRGFSAPSRTERRRDYAYGALAEDVLAIAEALGSPRPHVVGHDLGAVVGWHLAARQPKRVATLTAISVPHPAAYVRSLLRSPQALRSAYVPLFWLPGVAEGLFGARDGAVLRRVLRASGLAEERADRYAGRIVPEGGLQAAFSWYRNLSLPEMAATPPVSTPTTFVWSDGDVALDRVGAELTADQCVGPYRFLPLEGVSHWIPEEAPEALAEAIAERVLG